MPKFLIGVIMLSHDKTSVLKPAAFGNLVKLSKIESTRVEAQDEGLIVVARTSDDKEQILGAARGGKRIFQSIDGAASVLQKFGIMSFDCKIENWIPKTVTRGFKYPLQRELAM